MNLTHVVKRLSNRKGKEIEVSINDSGCHECISHPKNKDGYIRLYAGKFEVPRIQFLHRLVWKNYRGEIPDGFEVDHICRNRACCNIEHLQLLNKSEHKSKGNRLRYQGRIDYVRKLITQGYSNDYIRNQVNVSNVYINRHRRELNKLKE